MEEKINTEQLEKEEQLRKVFSDILSTLSIVLNDSIKWRKEHNRISDYLEIRNKEVEDVYKKISNIQFDIKKVLDVIEKFRVHNKQLVYDNQVFNSLFTYINNMLEKHKPYISLEQKEKEEKNCTTC